MYNCSFASFGIVVFGITNSLAPPAVRPPPIKPGIFLFIGEAIPSGVGNVIT